MQRALQFGLRSVGSFTIHRTVDVVVAFGTGFANFGWHLAMVANISTTLQFVFRPIAFLTFNGAIMDQFTFGTAFQVHLGFLQTHAAQESGKNFT